MPPAVLLTFDVEDWFQVENFKDYIPFSSWPSHELRVEKNTHRILDLLDSIGRDEFFPRATFFILGWVAERLPQLVREIHRRGHEVASHGYQHDTFHDCSEHVFKDDILRSKKILEDITGNGVSGFRAPTFSIDHRKLDVVENCGYLYDSSFNSFSANAHYGRLDLSRYERRKTAVKISASFFELPISNIRFGKYVLPWGGGGYFRMLPFFLFKKGVAALLRKEEAYLFYLHPWEIDPDQPRVKQAGRARRMRHYIHLKSTYAKLTSFFQAFNSCRFITCRQYLQEVY